jgi:hypothetical protein
MVGHSETLGMVPLNIADHARKRLHLFGAHSFLKPLMHSSQ